MPTFRATRHVMSLLPGDVLAPDPSRDIPLHNGDPRIIATAVVRTLEGTRYSVTFADGSITETPDGTEVVPVDRDLDAAIARGEVNPDRTESLLRRSVRLMRYVGQDQYAEPIGPSLAPSAPTLAPGVYVMDQFAASALNAIVAGPFETVDAAAQDRAERNIGGDCELYRFDGFKFEHIPASVALPHYGTAYHAPTDMYVDVHTTDSKSRTTITHPFHGVVIVPSSELTGLVPGNLRAN